MELWDILNEDGSKTGRFVERGKPMALGEYHLVVDVWIKNSNVVNNYAAILGLVKDIAIITLGENGSVLCEKSGCTIIKPSANVTVADTVGAGDSYLAAFCSQKLIGKTNAEACKFAAKAAEVTVSGVGAHSSMPDTEKMLQILS